MPGADDYLVKPFDLSELSARIGAVARRYAGNPNPNVEIGELSIDMAARSIMRAGRTIALTAREWSLFEAFLQRPRALLSKSQLEERLYSFDAEVESNTIEVYIGRLRKKLGHDTIETVRGMGYRLGQHRREPRTEHEVADLPPKHSLQRRLSLGLTVIVSSLWLAATVAAGLFLRGEIDKVLDSALQEVAQRVLPLAYIEVLNRDRDAGQDAPAQRVPAVDPHSEYITYIVRDAKGRLLLQSHDAVPEGFPADLQPGFHDRRGVSASTPKVPFKARCS